MYAPKIDEMLRILHNPYHMDAVYTKENVPLLKNLFSLLDAIEACGDDDRKELWIEANRGPIEAYGDYQELHEDEEFETYEEFETAWRNDYPEATSWYSITAVRYKDFQTIAIGPRVALTLSQETAFGFWDISELLRWVTEQVTERIEMMRQGTYNEYIRNNLPCQYRTGTLLRKYYWKVFPDAKEAYLKGIGANEVAEFLSCAEETPKERLSQMTASDFFHACSLGYRANHYKIGNSMTEKEQYYRFADGRDEGLNEVPEDDPEAFRGWMKRKNRGGHPYEVCRGGNSTHISLYVAMDGDSYYFVLAGNAWNRSVETVKFYLALKRAGLPVGLRDSKKIAARFTETDLIGIVPQGVFPAYCYGYFNKEQNDNMLDYMNLPHEKRGELVKYVEWIPETEQRLKG